MSQGPFSPKIRFLGQKVSSVARRQTDRKVKMVLKIPFFKISKNKKLSFFLMSQGSFSPKIRFLTLKGCPLDSLSCLSVCLSVCVRSTEHTFWPRNLIFGLKDPWDMRKKRNFLFFEMLKNGIFRAIFTFESVCLSPSNRAHLLAYR